MTCDCRQYDYTRTVDCTAVIFNVTKNSLCDSTFATEVSAELQSNSVRPPTVKSLCFAKVLLVAWISCVTSARDLLPAPPLYTKWTS